MEIPIIPVSPDSVKPTDNSPAVAIPKPTIKSPEKIAEIIKAKIKEGIAPVAKPAEKEGETAPPPDDLKDQKVPAKFLAELGRLQARVRELEPQLKELEPIKTDAELTRELKKLWNGNRDEKITALAKLSGKDGLDELASLVAMWYAEEQNADGAPGEKKPPSEMKAVLEKLDAVSQELADIKAGKKTPEQEKTELDASVKRGQEYVTSFIDRNKERFELCARDANKAEAVDLATSGALEIIKREKLDPKTMDQKQAEDIYLEALADVEKAFEETGKRMSKVTAPASNIDRFAEIGRRLSKPSIVVKPKEELSKNFKEREAQVRQRLAEKYGG